MFWLGSSIIFFSLLMYHTSSLHVLSYYAILICSVLSFVIHFILEAAIHTRFPLFKACAEERRK